MCVRVVCVCVCNVVMCVGVVCGWVGDVVMCVGCGRCMKLQAPSILRGGYGLVPLRVV